MTRSGGAHDMRKLAHLNDVYGYVCMCMEILCVCIRMHERIYANLLEHTHFKKNQTGSNFSSHHELVTHWKFVLLFYFVVYVAFFAAAKIT